MPKRKRSEAEDFDFLRKKLKKLQREIEKSCHRRRARVVESSPSPSPSPRESSPDPEDEVEEEPTTARPDSADGAGSTHLREENLSRVLDACSPPSPRAASPPLCTATPAPPPPPPSAGAGPPSPSPMPEAAAPTALPGPSTDAPPTVESVDVELDESILEILGDDPTAAVVYGKDIHKEIASRFEHFATVGLNKDTRKDLTTKYLVPANCVHIAAPLLNAEIKAALPEAVVKKDKAIESKQKHLATAISCLAGAITDQVNSRSKDQDLLKKLMDTGRLLCDIQHMESVTRRNFALFSLKKDIKEHISGSKIDKYLFGEKLAETLKSAKAVNRSSADIKADPKPATKPAPRPTQRAPPPKNWKTSAPARKQGTAPTRRSPAPRPPRAAASRQSPPRPRAPPRR